MLIHSAMRRVFRYLVDNGNAPDPALIIDSLLHEVGADGTILFPLFNFDFPESAFFSMHTTPSQMGTVTEFARTNYEGFRTGHPIYSFFAIGHKAEEFREIDNESGYGHNSPFAKILELDGKIAVIDLPDQNSMTMYHHVEEMNNVDYRYFKSFTGTYEDLARVSRIKTYKLFVRDLDKGVVTDVNRMGELLWREGTYQGNMPGIKNGMRTISAKSLFERTSREISEGRALDTLYSLQ